MPIAHRHLEADFKVLQRLRQACRITLERFVDVANHASGHLSGLTRGTVTDLGRANLALLRQKEDKAHAAYLKARIALLEYVLRDAPQGARQKTSAVSGGRG
jgi:hypothetical protein